MSEMPLAYSLVSSGGASSEKSERSGGAGEGGGFDVILRYIKLISCHFSFTIFADFWDRERQIPPVSPTVQPLLVRGPSIFYAALQLGG